jgi:hypothetical protein
VKVCPDITLEKRRKTPSDDDEWYNTPAPKSEPEEEQAFPHQSSSAPPTSPMPSSPTASEPTTEPYVTRDYFAPPTNIIGFHHGITSHTTIVDNKDGTKSYIHQLATVGERPSINMEVMKGKKPRNILAASRSRKSIASKPSVVTEVQGEVTSASSTSDPIERSSKTPRRPSSSISLNHDKTSSHSDDRMTDDVPSTKLVYDGMTFSQIKRGLKQNTFSKTRAKKLSMVLNILQNMHVQAQTLGTTILPSTAEAESQDSPTSLITEPEVDKPPLDPDLLLEAGFCTYSVRYVCRAFLLLTMTGHYVASIRATWSR